MAEPLLSIDRLSSGYGDFQALFDLSFDLQQGEMLGLVGANGAGKTTLFRAIMGLLPRRQDMVRFRGQPIGALPTSDLATLGIAMVPEGRRLFRSLSVEENLRIAADYGRKGHWTLERIYALFPILAEKRHAPALSLSGGQQQMVAIGRALIANPDLILFDEISLGLAPIVVNEVYAAFPAILASGVGAIVVEQDIARVRKIARHLVCIREGRIVLDGVAETLTLHDLTVAYFGE
ncbi:ABC transporter ATP-binding protein [Methylocella sp. CPCC 101449]|jgi:branched-chain amino acid transport system ATP-binding protein|uniref:ABC transporter ATP-binding protein n=1 Tax=Methylocella sp. CPCC 101449 TaxID=2987531 RepID=UPI00288EEA87|nr:ABC transporter ATP-binding protein [Methylocella sp. CPCC 101449]MDT2023130.1 ABC transporter ATP-binding protein [Methylocella sp. CPCC 101449]HEV2570208.1 ABC transporter ATP-binding protein [Beijerinckiaceae bacterium]